MNTWEKRLETSLETTNFPPCLQRLNLIGLSYTLTEGRSPYHCMCKYFSHKEAGLESLMIFCNFILIILQVALEDFVLVLVEQMQWMSWLIFHGNLNALRFVVQ